MTPTTSSTQLPRILVVDDMPDNLFLMNGLLEDRYEVVQAISGKEAIAAVMSPEPPDMVLLDIMMPDMDGYEVLRRIRQHPPTANVPVIFLTALASMQDERLGMELGAVDYLTKPVDPQQVVRRIEANVRANAYARRLEALSEKLSRHLSPHEWELLFNGGDADAVQFEQKQQTVLHADASGLGDLSPVAREALIAEIDVLAERHGGMLDPYSDAAALVAFDEPAACLRMAMDMQRLSSGLGLRIGIHTGTCEIATYCCGLIVRSSLIGEETWLVARVAATAAAGSIAISPETYALVQEDIRHDSSGCLLMEEFEDSDLAQVSLTPAPTGAQWQSTFAGLGRF